MSLAVTKRHEWPDCKIERGAKNDHDHLDETRLTRLLLDRLVSGNGRFLRHRILTEGKKHRNTYQFTKKKPRCQRGGVRGVANQHATTERSSL